MNTIIVLVLIVLVVAGLFWIGISIRPEPFHSFDAEPAQLKTVPLPQDLPAPVERYYRQIYGDEVPVITSAVISGRARMRPAGPFYLPARFRFTHDAGQGYRHYIEITFFGMPVLKINEHYLDGQGRMDIPILGVAQGPKTDQGANLGLWAEAIYMPSVYLTDPRVRWEALDDETALLVVPFGQEEQRFVVRFDPHSGRVRYFEAMRYAGEEAAQKRSGSPPSSPAKPSRLPAPPSTPRPISSGSSKGAPGPFSPSKRSSTTPISPNTSAPPAADDGHRPPFVSAAASSPSPIADLAGCENLSGLIDK